MKLSSRFSSVAGILAGAACFAATWSVGACESDIGAEPTESDFTHIGKSKVVRKGLFEIGDLDGNGVVDYAWLTPKEKDSTGAIRVYLMENPSKTLSIRHIIPGKWGFVGHNIVKGDRFGESIAQIGDVNNDGVQDLAVGAPGDSETGKDKGAVYILLMKKDGSVLSSQKISAKTDLSLGRQHVAGEGFGSKIQALQDVNGDNVKELSVQSKDGSQTMVLLNKQGKSISCMKFSAGIDTKVLEPRLSEGKIRVMPLRFDGLEDGDVLENQSVKPTESQCFFNQTHCACDLFESKTSTCLTTVASEAGKTVCLRRPCGEGYKCDCNGKSMCSIKTQTESSYAVLPGTPSDPNLVYCGVLLNSLERVTLIEGAAVPTPGPIEVSPDNAWTPTQCMCSPAKDLQNGQSICLDLATTEGSNFGCTERACKEDDTRMVCDATGTSVCSHETVENTYYKKLAGPFTWTPPAPQVNCELDTKMKERAVCIKDCPTQ